MKKAEYWFRHAAELDKVPLKTRAEACRWCSTIAEENNDLPLAISYLKDALYIEPNIDQQQHLEELEVLLARTGYNRAQITRALLDTRGFIPALPVNFKFNSTELTGDGRKQLEQLGQALAGKKLKDKHFRLVGHTDSKGTEEYNLQLSIRRARAIQQWLMDNYSIAAENIEIQGMGESCPRRTPEVSKEDRLLNRRVEITRLD